MSYTNLFIQFLNGENTIKISGVKEFESFNSLCKKVGLDIWFKDYWDLLYMAQINHCAINNSTILIEYQPHKGISIGYKSVEDSEKWYGQKPWTMLEVRRSLNV